MKLYFKWIIWNAFSFIVGVPMIWMLFRFLGSFIQSISRMSERLETMVMQNNLIVVGAILMGGIFGMWLGSVQSLFSRDTFGWGRSWVIWTAVANAIGFPVFITVAFPILFTDKGYYAFVVFGMLIGLSTGLAQWVCRRNEPRLRIGWIVSSCAGMALGFSLGFPLLINGATHLGNVTIRLIIFSAGLGILYGIVTGLSLFAVLRVKKPRHNNGI